MKEVKKKTYQAPKLTAVSFKAERGYFVSGEETLRLSHDEVDGGNNEPMESYNERYGWGSGEGFWD